MCEEDGAIWLRTADFGDPREKRVLRKSPDQGGDYTYLAGDIAYHRNKFLSAASTGSSTCGAPTTTARWPACRPASRPSASSRDRLEVRLGQMVSLASGRIGKRLGNAVDLDDLVDDIGPDVMRLLSLLTSIDQAPTIDLDKVRAESKEKPVFYVQYAHARIHSIGRKAAEAGVERRPLDTVDLSLLVHERELELLRTLSELPEVVGWRASTGRRTRSPTWVRELADRFHGFYHDCYVLGDDVPPELTQARLWLVEARPHRPRHRARPPRRVAPPRRCDAPT